MATSAGEIEVKLTANAAQFKAVMGQSKDQLQGFSNNAKAIMGGLAAVFSFAAIGKFFKDSLDAYGKQEIALAKLTSALENQGIASEKTVRHLSDYASALQTLTGIEDDVINTAQATLVTFGLQGAELDRTTQAAIDMSAAMGIDLVAATQLLGKAFVGETGTLARYGIMIGKNIDPAKKFAAALEQVEGRFGGSAQAQAETFAGQMKILGAVFGDLQEEIGRMLAGSGAGLVTWLTTFTLRVTDSIKLINDQITSLGSWAAMLKGVALEALRSIVNMITEWIIKQSHLIGLIPGMGSAMEALRGKINGVSTAINNKINAQQADISNTAMATAAAVKGEQAKQQAFQNTHVTWVALTNEQDTLMKDRLAEEIKLRAEHAETLETAQQDFYDTFVTTQADMWNFAQSLATSFMSSVGRGFADMIVDGKNFADSMTEMFRDMAKQIIAWIVEMIIKMIIFIALKEAAQSFGPVGMAISGAMSAAAGSGLTGVMAGGGMISEPSILTGLRSGRQHMVGEAGPEAVVPMNRSNAEGGSGGVTINISGQFIEGDTATWQKLINEKIVPAIRRFTMATPTGPFTRRRGVA